MVGLGDIEAFFSLKDRFIKWRNTKPVVTNTAQRFIRLFEAHGISRAQIPRFFGHNLTINQVEDEIELSKILDTNLLEAVATLFGIRLEWLEGGTDELYDINHFYKQSQKFGEWLDSLTADTDKIKIDGWLLTTKFKTDQYDALILMREKIGELADENIYRYYFCEQWIYGYWKCRADIAACVAQGWKRNQYITGRILTQKVFNKFISLKFVPDSELEDTVIANQRFQAEDLTLNPNFFVQGLSEGQFGIENAVALWLEYQQLGFMDSGFGNKRSVFEQFQLKN
ncbi:hypothetical protein [Shewanella frigidimarina]|uniref:hypothetical protein n=1 Tax=Shewanella frigidimarina TaxID=56812 RepID=UPI003D7BA130